MGNGDTVTCHGAGTPYQDSFGAKPSPTCGYTYTRPSPQYGVTATSHWVVDWTSSNGDAGQIRFALVANTSIAIGESQALTDALCCFLTSETAGGRWPGLRQHRLDQRPGRPREHGLLLLAVQPADVTQNGQRLPPHDERER